MTTIPIEVIVQDAEAPAVPGEDGTNNTETNITVPDTGTISSSGDTSSSASSIILPAILLVIAIGSIVAILIHKYRKQKKDKTSKKEKLAVATSSTIAVLAVTVLIGNLVIPVTKAATSDVTDGITPAEDKVSIIVTRDGGVAEASIESTATITSTSDFGYKVLLSMVEGAETSNLYLDGDTTSQYYIASVEAENEEGIELTDNTWGYALEESGSYSAIPLLDDAATVAEGDEPVEDEVLSIYYGVKVSSDLPAGTYSGGEVEYNLVALEPTISTLTYMQDFAKLSESGKASVLRSMIEDEQYTLKDSRDKKDYFIAKLADGNVWMTQNLDLDLISEPTAEEYVALTPANTNITADWTPANSTIATEGTSVPGWESSNTAPYSADPGDVYYYTSNTNDNDIRYNSLAECEAVHDDGTCQHYHAGNYYNWSAAVANNNTAKITEPYTNVETSICPAGWRLPKNRNAESPTEGNEQDTMISSYNGIVGEPHSDCGGTCVTRDYLDGGFNKIRTAPLWLARSGRIYYGSPGELGRSGSYWSSTVGFSSGRSYNLYLAPDYVSPVDDNNRGSGYSVRCVAQ